MFGKRLNEVRHMKGYTAQQMADHLNMELRSYRNYESGHRQPAYTVLLEIADFLDVSLDYLFGRDEFIRKQSKSDESTPEP